MNKLSLFLIALSALMSTSSFSQVQIGNDIDGEAAGDRSGFSCTLSEDGSFLAVGAPFNEGTGPGAGHVRIFENVNGTWTQVGNDIDAQTLGDQTGQAIRLSSDGSIIAIGEPINDEIQPTSGQVRVFENLNGVWTQIGSDINGDGISYQMGHCVDISDDGTILASGAFGADVPGLGAFTGHARVFENINGTWTQIGNDLEGEEGLDLYGSTVSLSADGSIIAIGAPGNPSTQEIGYVQVLQNIGGTWTQIGSNIVGPTNNYGNSISLSADGTILAIGGGFANPEGEVQVFENIGGAWVQIGSDLVGEVAGDNFGIVVSLSADGGILAVSATDHSSEFPTSGRTYLFHNQGGNWIQIGSVIDGEAAGDRSGFSLNLSRDASTLCIGSPINDGNGNEAGHVRVFDLTAFVSLNELENPLNVKLFPNPATDFLQIDLTSELQLINAKIYDAKGHVVLTSTEVTIDLREIASGNYLVEIETETGMIMRKLTIQ